eukprot:1064450-Alexandrium_andersonii.AAC.1
MLGCTILQHPCTAWRKQHPCTALPASTGERHPITRTASVIHIRRTLHHHPCTALRMQHPCTP